jgi:hypothetical protein
MATSNNICTTRNFRNGWKSFNAICDCGTDEHSHDLIIKYGKEFNSISLTLYFKTWSQNLYNHESRWVDIWNNIKMRLTYLVKGCIIVNYEFLFRNEDAIQDYIDALQTTLNEYKQFKKEQQSNANQ